MSEKIEITKLKAAPDFDPLHHPVGAMMSTGDGTIVTFPYYKEDQIGNFNEAARQAFDEYIKDKDLTPKKRNLYSGKIVLVNTKQENNRYSSGTAILNVRDGLVQELGLLNRSKDLRIENDMTCSDLYKRAIDMYFGGACWFDKVMYVNDFELQ